mmetsp:Transcript_11782/g.41254  ORF Transcript_11782/g.41254 Transcript_11782/m.41254 type:complete len:274 (+) Transcript_11782:439-1260(+)
MRRHADTPPPTHTHASSKLLHAQPSSSAHASPVSAPPARSVGAAAHVPPSTWRLLQYRASPARSPSANAHRRVQLPASRPSWTRAAQKSSAPQAAWLREQSAWSGSGGPQTPRPRSSTMHRPGQALPAEQASPSDNADTHHPRGPHRRPSVQSSWAVHASPTPCLHEQRPLTHACSKSSPLQSASITHASPCERSASLQVPLTLPPPRPSHADQRGQGTKRCRVAPRKSDTHSSPTAACPNVKDTCSTSTHRLASAAIWASDAATSATRPTAT